MGSDSLVTSPQKHRRITREHMASKEQNSPLGLRIKNLIAALKGNTILMLVASKSLYLCKFSLKVIRSQRLDEIKKHYQLFKCWQFHWCSLILLFVLSWPSSDFPLQVYMRTVWIYLPKAAIFSIWPMGLTNVCLCYSHVEIRVIFTSWQIFCIDMVAQKELPWFIKTRVSIQRHETRGPVRLDSHLNFFNIQYTWPDQKSTIASKQRK